MDDHGLLSSDTIEDGRFLYVPRPGDFQNGLAPVSFACFLFVTRWERGRVQAAKRMCAKKRLKSKEMERPFLVSYDDGYWLHYFHTANSYLQRSSLIVWWKGQETMHNLKPVCGAS